MSDQDDLFESDLFDVPAGEAPTRELNETRFPCGQCGAVLHYKIGTSDLQCHYCGHTNQINRSLEPIVELDLERALRTLQQAPLVEPVTDVISCPNCAAEFALGAHMHSGECPFCGTTVVTGTGAVRPIKPKALLPFAITAEQATQSYKKWLAGRWFAPSGLKEFARDDAPLNGVYIPYWTYDSDTSTAYQGERGDVYYVTQMVTVIQNGRRVRQRRRVPKIRWTPVSGRTARHFDDVLVGATRTLPRTITDWLEPWDLDNLVPYTPEYLSGFNSEVYQVQLDEGFNVAQASMDRIIRSDVARAIGGDQQRIHRLQTAHSDTTFKHVLLPVWSAAFLFRDKSYRFVVNGRTGKLKGERPYSRLKIALAVLAGAIVLSAVVYVANESGMTSSFDNGVDVWRTDTFDTNRWPIGTR